MSDPTVSVLMPVYNCERYLDEAIRSIREQTFTDFEFVIVNDGPLSASAECPIRCTRALIRGNVWALAE